MSTHKNQWNKRHGFDKDASHSKAELARVSKVPIRIIDEVFDRGVGAHKTNPESVRVKGTFKKNASAPISKKLSAEQWAYARVYAFLNKIEGKQKLNHDQDLAAKIK